MRKFAMEGLLIFDAEDHDDACCKIAHHFLAMRKNGGRSTLFPFIGSDLQVVQLSTSKQFETLENNPRVHDRVEVLEDAGQG